MSNRRIFYDTTSGELIHEIGRRNTRNLPTIEQDVATWTSLSERNRDTFDVLQLTFEEYESDFRESRLIGINLETKVPIFEIPNPDNPEEPIVLDKPMSVQIENLKEENLMNMMAMVEMFETNIKLEQENTSTMMAVAELYEMIIGGM